MGRGQVTTLPNGQAPEADHESAPDKPAVAVDRGGFNLHAGVRIEAGDDMGRERLCRYGCRPPLSLERLRRLPGGRVAYRLKFVTRGRGKFRVMTAMDFMARLSALIAPPRYPLVRYAGVLGPRSTWRKDIVPKPRERRPECVAADVDPSGNDTARPPAKEKTGEASPPRPGPQLKATGLARPPDGGAETIKLVNSVAAGRGDVIALTPNVIAVRHWDRLLGGVLYAASPRIDWATLLRRSLGVDVMACAKCGGRLRVLALITEREPVRRILAHLGLPSELPPPARARDPTDDMDDMNDVDLSGQLGLGFA